MNESVERQVAYLRALSGCTVLRWQGIEMALREAGEDNQPNWRDWSIPFLQLSRLNLSLAGSPTTSIIAYQNDDRWGLYREDGLPPSRLCTDEADGIFRSRTFDELPRVRFAACW